jgi:hypothetical protein
LMLCLMNDELCARRAFFLNRREVTECSGNSLATRPDRRTNPAAAEFQGL